MSEPSITQSEYKQIKNVRKIHATIRAVCTIVILLAVINFVYLFFNKLNTFPVDALQTEIIAELEPLRPQVQSKIFEIYNKRQPEIHGKINAAFHKHAPEIRQNFQKEFGVFMDEFPTKVASSLEKQLEASSKEYGDILVEKYPSLANTEEWDAFLKDTMSELIAEGHSLIEHDVNKIHNSVTTIQSLYESPPIQREIEALIQRGNVEDQLIGISLRLWAKEYPGADIGYTIGKI